MMKPNKQVVLLWLWLLSSLYLSVVTNAGDYTPSWQVNDTWDVRVTYKTAHPKGRIVVTGESPYPHSEYFEYQEHHVTNTYHVKAVDQKYDLKPPLRDPFVSRPGQPNAQVNSINVTVLEVTGPEGHFGLSNWSLVFDLDKPVLLEALEKRPGKDPVSSTNPYGKEAWFTEFLGDMKAIHDFPLIPQSGNDETRAITDLNGDVTFTQTVTFAENTVTCILSRHNTSYDLEQTVTIIWQKGKPWWNTAEVKLGSAVVVLAERLEQQ